MLVTKKKSFINVDTNECLTDPSIDQEVVSSLKSPMFQTMEGTARHTTIQSFDSTPHKCEDATGSGFASPILRLSGAVMLHSN